MLKLLVLTVLLAVISANPLTKDIVNELNGRILGGKNTTIDKVPYHVSVQFGGHHRCSGSIISENWVISTCDCVDTRPKLVKIRAGSTFHDDGGSLHNVAETIRHKGCERDDIIRLVNNIALVRVEEPFIFDKTRQPIRLYNVDEKIAPGTLSTITGWHQAYLSEPVLQMDQVPVISKESCYEQYADYNGILDGEICTPYPEGWDDKCQDDAGGPLVINGRLAGIESWRSNCVKPGYPDVYIEIASHRYWIKQHSGV